MRWRILGLQGMSADYIIKRKFLTWDALQMRMATSDTSDCVPQRDIAKTNAALTSRGIIAP